jgi:hypothetical protein
MAEYTAHNGSNIGSNPIKLIPILRRTVLNNLVLC